MVFSVWTNVDSSGTAKVYVHELEVAAEVNGQPIYADRKSGRVRPLHLFEAIFPCESDAYAEGVRQLGKVRDNLDACIAEAAAKAAGGRVGEAVPS